MSVRTSDTPGECGVTSAAAVSLGSLESFGARLEFDASESIYRCGERCEFWYRLIKGAARKCAFSLDGARQIVDFLRPGDLFGFGTGDLHPFSVEALVTGTLVARYPRAAAERLADFDPQVARQVRELVFESTARIQARIVILGRTSAIEKVSLFLLEMADSFCARSTCAVILPMSRYDIADYLAMSVETVSRALTTLRSRGLIHFGGVRSIQIRDRAALETSNAIRSCDATDPDTRPSGCSARRSHTAHSELLDHSL
jgi:CRP-like cAMP-binding protein